MRHNSCKKQLALSALGATLIPVCNQNDPVRNPRVE